MRITFSFLFLAAVMISGPALAQTAEEEAACKPDFEKFCQGVEPGGGRVIECLSKHKSELSAECQKVVTAHGG